VSQSSLLVGLLAVTFLLYVAAKGRLPVYTGVLWGKESGGSGSGGSGGGGSDLAKTASTAVDIAKVAALFA